MCNIYCMSVTINVLTTRMMMKTHQASNVSVHYHNVNCGCIQMGQALQSSVEVTVLREKEAISQSIDFSQV